MSQVDSLRAPFARLLTTINETVQDSYWEVLGTSSKGLYKATGFADFTPRETWRSHIKANEYRLHRIAHGYDIWNRADALTAHHRIHVLSHYGAFFSHNQGTERAVKDQNLAGSNGREEMNVSVRMVAMSLLKEVTR